MNITSKAAMYTLLRQGAFGNTPETWRTESELIESGYLGEVGIRNLVGSGGVFYPHLSVLSALMIFGHLKFCGQKAIFSESAPDHLRTIQGEVCEYEGQLYFDYSFEKTHLRAAMRHATQSVGLAARTILRSYLSPSSYEDLMTVLELYPGHVVEFTAFETCVGNLRGRNSYTWEVRKY